MERSEGEAVSVERAYYQQIRKEPLLSAEQEVVLGVAVQAGVQARQVLACGEYQGQAIGAELEAALKQAVAEANVARDQFVRANLRMAYGYARRYRSHSQKLQFLDIMSAATEGVIIAVDKFDPTKGLKFSSYATEWIEQRIQRLLGDEARTIRLPVRRYEELMKYLRISQGLHAKLARTPTNEEVAQAMSVSVARVQKIRSWPHDSMSLDAHVEAEDSDDPQSLYERVAQDLNPVEDQVVGALFTTQMQAVLRELLSPLQFAAISGEYGFDGAIKTREEIALAHNTTAHSVKGALHDGLKKLRKAYNEGALQEFLP